MTNPRSIYLWQGGGVQTQLPFPGQPFSSGRYVPPGGSYKRIHWAVASICFTIWFSATAGGRVKSDMWVEDNLSSCFASLFPQRKVKHPSEPHQIHNHSHTTTSFCSSLPSKRPHRHSNSISFHSLQHRCHHASGSIDSVQLVR